MIEGKSKTKESVLRRHIASILVLSITVAVAVLLVLSPAHAASTSPCGACHGSQGYSQTLSITGSQIPSTLTVGQTATVTATISNSVNVNKAAYNVLSGVSASLGSQSGHFSISSPSVNVGTLSAGASSTVTWQITGVSAGADSAVFSGTAKNAHQSLSFADSSTRSFTIVAPAPAPTPIPTPSPILTPSSTPTPSPSPTPTPTPTLTTTPTTTLSPTQTASPNVISTPIANPTSNPTSALTLAQPQVSVSTSVNNSTSAPSLNQTPAPDLTNKTSIPRVETQTNSEYEINPWSPTLESLRNHWPYVILPNQPRGQLQTTNSTDNNSAASNTAPSLSWSIPLISSIPVMIPLAGLGCFIGRKVRLQARKIKNLGNTPSER